MKKEKQEEVGEGGVTPGEGWGKGSWTGQDPGPSPPLLPWETPPSSTLQYWVWQRLAPEGPPPQHNFQFFPPDGICLSRRYFQEKAYRQNFWGRAAMGQKGGGRHSDPEEFKPPARQSGNQSPLPVPQSRTAQDRPIPLVLQSRELRPWELELGVMELLGSWS